MIDTSKLSAAEKKALFDELNAEQKRLEDQVKSERANYKQMVSTEVKAQFPALKECSKVLADLKKHVFASFKALIEMKAELYNRPDDQYSHTFTDEEGNISITLGRNITDGWDDTADTGIAKVKDFLGTLSKDKNSEILVNTVLKLLSRDGKGNLKGSRVLQLKKMADETGNIEFIEAIKIIQDAYRPVLSKEYIRCEYKDESGNKIMLPLSITEAEAA